MTAKQIAIDGPAGAGKSTVAKQVADRLGYLYIDTGAMYRAVAWLALQRGLALGDEEALVRLAEEAEINLTPAAGGCAVWFGEQNISAAIRAPEVGAAASPISAISGVRRALVSRQQALAADQPVVMDGRDIGTVVLPQAACKIYLTAHPHIRAQRRTDELRALGRPADLDVIEAQMVQRDYQDCHRQDSPLCAAEDALRIDSSHLSIRQVVETILQAAAEAEP